MSEVVETPIQAAIQVTFRGMSAFDDADVTINDWRILDQAVEKAPYIIIENSDEFNSRQDTVTPRNTWNIPVTLFERFTDWKPTLDNFRTRRDAIVGEFNEVGTNRSPGADSTAMVTVDSIRSDGPLTPWNYPWRDPETRGNDLPDFIAQRIIMEVRTF